jgi:hypothetical protein
MAQSPAQYHPFPPPYTSQHPPPPPHSPQHPPPEPYPPTKRPRLSPNPPSPYDSPQPQLTNGSIPNNNFFVPPTNQHGYHTPGPYVNGVPRQNSPASAHPSPGLNHLAPPPPTPGSMGPPSRPADEKPVDVNDLGDVVASSGIDIREEEAALINRQRKAGQNSQSTSFGSTQNSSFNSSLPTQSVGYFDHPTGGYSVYSPIVPGDRNSFYGASTFGQPSVSQQDLEEQTKQKQRAQIRKRADIGSHHLVQPFIEGRPLDIRLRQKAEALGVQMPQPITVGSSHPGAETKVIIIGPDNHEKLAVVTEKTPLAPIGPASDILALISLGCKDRIRTLLEQSTFFARGRKATANGAIPLDLKDIAVGQGTAEEVTLNLPSPASSLKRRLRNFLCVFILINLEQDLSRK